MYYLPNSGGEDPYEYTYMSGDYNEDTWREPQHQRRQHWGYSVAGEYPATMDNELYEVRVGGTQREDMCCISFCVT